MMFNTGSNQGSTNGAPDGAPSSCQCGNTDCTYRGCNPRTELARYKAGLNYRRGYLDALKSLQHSVYVPMPIRGGDTEWLADEAVKKFMEAFR